MAVGARGCGRSHLTRALTPGFLGVLAVGDETAQGGAWVPAFPGQRPPFQPGNVPTNSTHNAYSPRWVEPLAAEFVSLTLADPTVPGYVKAPAYRAELYALGRAEAQVQLITEWLAKQAESTGDVLGGLASESVRAAYLLLHRAEGRASSSRSRLGLTPTAAARMGKHVAQGAAANADVAKAMAQLEQLERDGRTVPGGDDGE